ncbi:MAG: TonB-dependent receptor [Sphingomonadales bacterium]
MRALVVAVAIAAMLVPSHPVGAQSAGDEVIVTAPRLQEPAARAAYAVTRLDGDDLIMAPQPRVDAILQSVPGVTLFRRASSLVAHPTTQGVSVRGLGPNGAGRALVLLDGVPLNDPFGGWVHWSALDPEALAGIEVLRGSGAGPHGNQALTGVIRLTSRQPDGPSLRGSLRQGAFATTDLALAAGHRIGDASFALSGRWFETDGFHLRTPAQRGAVDVPAASDAASLQGRFSYQLSATATLSARLAWFEEDRVNGTPLARNATEGLDGALSLVVDQGRDGISAQLTAYLIDRDFTNGFTAVADDRGSERPVLDQFAVPSQGLGAIGLIRLPVFADGVLEFGADIRRLDGQTNERFRNLGAGFTRLRQAGGDQWLAGGWVEYAGTLTPRLSIAGGVRVDYWRNFNGLLRESNLADGAIVRDDMIEDRSNVLANGRLGLRYQATPALAWRLAGYSGFRLPSLNEFFRPFRVGNDITEANPDLAPERLYGVETGLAYQPVAGLGLSVDYFRNWLQDGVGNVTLAAGPGFFPPTGFVPAGGSLRQRRNIDRIVADGVETEIRIAWGDDVTVTLRHLFVRARVTKSADFPVLEGNILAQSPKHRFSLAAAWQPTPRWQLNAALHHVGDQFEDDLSSRVLDGYFSLDASISHQAREGVHVFLAAENLFDALVVSQIDGAGLISRAQPRFVSGGVRFSF